MSKWELQQICVCQGNPKLKNEKKVWNSEVELYMS